MSPPQASGMTLGHPPTGGIDLTANAADVAVTMKSDTTGWIDNINCMLTDNAANITEALVGAAMQFGNELYVCNLAGERVVQSNITASTDA